MSDPTRDPTVDPTTDVVYDNTRPNDDPTRRTPDRTPDLTLTPEPEHLDMEALAIPAAAERLGLTTDAIRMRLKRGTIAGRKVEGRWVVLVPRLNAAQTSTERVDLTPANPTERSTQRPTEQPTERDQSPPVAAVDLRPFVEHLERKDAEIRQLMDAAMSWQYRAVRAEERLAALEAGDVAGDSTRDAIEVPPRDDGGGRAQAPAEASPEPLPTPSVETSDPERPRWRQWLLDRLGGS